MDESLFETPAGTLKVRNAREDDIPRLIEVYARAFPGLIETDELWQPDQLQSHIEIFPEGQFVAELDGNIVGAASSLIVNLGKDPLRPHTYYGITDDGYFYNHDYQGDTLYGADVYVDPKVQRAGIGNALYSRRRDLCRKLNLRRILSGGRLWNYEKYAAEFSPQEYVARVQAGEIHDQVLTFQLNQGFVVRAVMPNYIRDKRSQDHASLIEWLNPDYQSNRDEDSKVRVSCVQYQMRRLTSFEDFEAQVKYFVSTAADYKSEFVLFPEFFSVQLLSQMDPATSQEGIRKLAECTDRFINLISGLAREFGLYVIAGSHPVMEGDKLYNKAMLFRPDGSYVAQPKLHITPSERIAWGITGGNELMLIQTPKAKVGILICYDIEFPEAARYLAEKGAEIIFVPYCTDNRQGFLRVSLCAHARAIENQIYVVTAGVVGNLPDVPVMDIHYGRATVYTPSDFEFARDGIQAQSDANVETMLVTDLDISDLYRSRESGSVTPVSDRRRDLFEFKSYLRNSFEKRGVERSVVTDSEES
ncbi:Predicted amidohydrolase [Rubritalea squalenifaciens DSM 18772]|uniref:Predicted amidohydrolase n=1 Tax=Rubritalea squalenifaciens DSM 18772 TaxID=1123071 RepID=A0A1M6P3E7_9BACT|nr:bifunctional GNAT family N-acetyltransferase/carbon-nitrogen hydrolase family protein [Rubritalea squalenifaciens]SHK02440.1 Predicted amidohydrolase [Rubritalea squalenifaciens DSM 18772]